MIKVLQTYTLAQHFACMHLKDTSKNSTEPHCTCTGLEDNGESSIDSLCGTTLCSRVPRTSWRQWLKIYTPKPLWPQTTHCHNYPGIASLKWISIWPLALAALGRSRPGWKIKYDSVVWWDLNPFQWWSLPLIQTAYIHVHVYNMIYITYIYTTVLLYSAQLHFEGWRFESLLFLLLQF